MLIRRYFRNNIIIHTEATNVGRPRCDGEEIGIGMADRNESKMEPVCEDKQGYRLGCVPASAGPGGCCDLIPLCCFFFSRYLFCAIVSRTGGVSPATRYVAVFLNFVILSACTMEGVGGR